MEVKEKSKKRELIKTIAIVFLTVLLLLTFFSQTIMNASLPEVATQAVAGGTINAKIRGTGTASANESYEVILDQTRKIRSVCVKVGDTVEQGDLLFVLGDVESEELKTAQEALQTLNLDYQKKILGFSKEYATEDRSVAKLQEDLEKAIADRDANVVTDAEISYAKGDLAAAKTEASKIEQLLTDLTTFETENVNYLDAKKAVETWEKETAELESAVKAYETQLEAIEDGDIAASDRALDDARRKLENANASWRSNWMAYAKDLDKLISKMRDDNEDRDWKNIQPLSTTADGSPQRITEQQQIYLDAYIAVYGNTKPSIPSGDGNTKPSIPSGDEERESDAAPIAEDTVSKGQTAYDNLIAAQDAVDAAQVAYDRAREDRNDISDEPTEQRREVQRKLDSAQSDLTRAQRELRSAQSALETMTSTYREQKNRYTAAQQEAKDTVETLTEALDKLTEKQEAYKTALETISAKERELEDALSGKDIDKQLDNLDLQSTRLEIQKQQELVNKYREDTIDTEIKANVSGTVSAINVTAGKDNKPGEAMAVIDVVDRGFTIRIPVTNDQARQVKIGDEAEVTNYYWGGDVKATLEAIANDPSKPGQGKLLVFRVTGEVEAGTSLTLAVGQQSAAFETIVPKSALRSDSNGDFVLVITAKSTPLGNRYTATRADVQILASDDVSAAVSGLSAGDYVITTSSKPLDAGTQVRMVENQ